MDFLDHISLCHQLQCDSVSASSGLHVSHVPAIMCSLYLSVPITILVYSSIINDEKHSEYPTTPKKWTDCFKCWATCEGMLLCCQFYMRIRLLHRASIVRLCSTPHSP